MWKRNSQAMDMDDDAVMDDLDEGFGDEF